MLRSGVEGTADDDEPVITCRINHPRDRIRASVDVRPEAKLLRCEDLRLNVRGVVLRDSYDHDLARRSASMKPADSDPRDCGLDHSEYDCFTARAGIENLFPYRWPRAIGIQQDEGS